MDNARLETQAQPIATMPWQTRFFAIWGGQACSLMGSQLVQFALIWQITQQTNSATTLALASLAGLLPDLLLSPLIGALVDRGNRRRMMILADGGVALATAGLALLYLFDLVTIWHIYLILFLRAVGGGVHRSAFGASIVLMAPREQLARIQGLNQSLQGAMGLLAAPLGALLVAWLPMPGILLIDVGTAFLAILPLLFFAIPQPVVDATAAARTSLWQEMLAGLRYILAWRGLTIVLLLLMVINLLLTPTSALLPLLVTRELHGDALTLGWLEAASSAGFLAGGALLAAWGGFRRRVLTAQCGLIGIGVGTCLTGLAPDLGLALAAVAVAGLMLPITNGSYGAILQMTIDPAMQGRVFAIIFSAATAMAPFGLLVAGPLADRVGVRLWYLVAGIICVFFGAVGFFIPAVMEMGAGEMGRQGDGEMGRWGDGEMGRWGDTERLPHDK